AADRLAQDVLRTPDRYGPALCLNEYPKLAPFARDARASFLRRRPGNLDFLFSEVTNTRGVYVMPVRGGENSITWVGTEDIIPFLKAKTLTGRNTSHAGGLNVYVNAPSTDELQGALYAWFVDDAFLTTPPPGGGVLGVDRPPTRIDAARALYDGGHFETSNFTARAYAAAVAAFKRGQTEFSAACLRKADLSRRWQGGDRSALADVQIRFAQAVVAQGSAPLTALAAYGSLIEGHRDAKTPALQRFVAMARLNRGIVLAHLGRADEASAEWLAIERAHTFSTNPELARNALYAATNRATAHRTPTRDAFAAHERILLVLGLPPKELAPYVIVMRSLAALAVLAGDRHMLSRHVRELADLSLGGPGTLLQTTALSALAAIAVAIERPADHDLRNIVVLTLLDTVARSSFAPRELEDTAQILAGVGTVRSVRDELCSETPTPIGKRGRAYPPAGWARIDLFIAQVLASANHDGGAMWFQRVLHAYAGLEAPQVLEVVREARRRLGVATHAEGLALAIERPKPVAKPRPGAMNVAFYGAGRFGRPLIPPQPRL
ncbi:MAG: hypothetical protein ACLQVI_18510, partial [Polyangiaceae bacterium]